MMRHQGFYVLPFAFIVLAGCQPPPDDATGQNGDRTLTATVTYRERMALPPGATVAIRLEAIATDAPGVVVAERTIRAEGRQVPLSVDLHYPASEIEPGGRYDLHAEIRTAAGDVLFATPSPHAVLERDGFPAEAEIVVQRVQTPAAAEMIPEVEWQLVAIQRPEASAEAVAAEPLFTIEFGADGRYAYSAEDDRLFRLNVTGYSAGCAL